MKILRSLFFIILIFGGNCQILLSKELNYIQSNLMRISSQYRTEEWVVPFYGYYKNSIPLIQLNIFGITNPDVPDLIDDIDSKDQNRISKRLDESFGNPYDASAKVGIQGRIGRLIQSFSTNAGAVAIVSDPVFPELELLLFQDYFATTSYLYTYDKRLLISPKIGYGYRRILDSSFTAAQLAEKKQDTKIKNKPWKFLAEIGVATKYKFDYFDLLFEVNSLPITNNPYSYWDTNLGIKSRNISKYLPLFDKQYLYLSYSPFYGGEYDVVRTIEFGTSCHFLNNFIVDLFFQDELSLGVIAKAHFKYFDFSLITTEKSYDDYGLQKSRQYGFDIKIRY